MLPSVSNLFKRAFAPYRTHPKVILKFTLLFFLPIFVVELAGFSVDLISIVYGIVPTGALLFIVGAICMSLLSLWFTISYIQALADMDEGRPLQATKEYLKKTARLILPVFGLSFLVGLIVVGGFILVIIPGIIFSIWFTFVAQARVLDKKKGVSALGFSRTLVKGNWWGVFGRIVVGILAVLAIMAVYQSIVNMFSHFDVDTLTFQKLTVFSFILTIITSAVQAIVTPFASGIPTILYLDLKKSKPASENPGTEVEE